MDLLENEVRVSFSFRGNRGPVAKHCPHHPGSGGVKPLEINWKTHENPGWADRAPMPLLTSAGVAGPILLAGVTLLGQPTCCAAPAAAGPGTGPCHGPAKCATPATLAPGTGGFCVGFEGPNVFCYGDAAGCMWGSTECTSDADCGRNTPPRPRSVSSQAILSGVLVIYGCILTDCLRF